MHCTIRGRRINYRISAITEKYRSTHGSRCERVQHGNATEATILVVSGRVKISSCDSEVCKAKAIHLATSFARAKMDTDQWGRSPRKMIRDLKRAIKEISEG